MINLSKKSAPYLFSMPTLGFSFCIGILKTANEAFKSYKIIKENPKDLKKFNYFSFFAYLGLTCLNGYVLHKIFQDFTSVDAVISSNMNLHLEREKLVQHQEDLEIERDELYHLTQFCISSILSHHFYRLQEEGIELEAFQKPFFEAAPNIVRYQIQTIEKLKKPFEEDYQTLLSSYTQYKEKSENREIAKGVFFKVSAFCTSFFRNLNLNFCSDYFEYQKLLEEYRVHHERLNYYQNNWLDETRRGYCQEMFNQIIDFGFLNSFLGNT